MSSSGEIDVTITADVAKELADVYKLAEPDLSRVNAIILGRIRHSDPIIDEILRYSFRLGGKRLRPLLLILSARACGLIRREHYLCAAALEMIHTGSLIHDDILDGARFRRHLETINLHWDSQFAVLAGDLLLTLAISLVTECSAPEIYPIISGACRKTCEGELLQIACRGHLDLSRKEYDRIIEGKTAALLEAACRVGASLSDCDGGTAEIFSRFGHALGMAFQIFDDVLDLTGVDDETGKTLGTDLLNQKMTLPAIRFFETASKAEKQKVLTLFRSPDFGPTEAEAIRLILIESGSVQYARQTALDLVEDALCLLDPLSAEADPRQAEALCALGLIARFIANRSI
ncbi:MAG: polyprenyl synthetase family protein [Thermoguttaceae bacterium]|jgi:octaprenyl-diphosphate synthase